MEEEDRVVVIADKDMWLDRDQVSLFYVNQASIFYDDFPPLPDFPCTSSSSSSTKPIAGTSSSSATSWAMNAEEESTTGMSFQQLQEEVKMDGDVDCIDVMENLGYMDLIDCNELWDPSSVLQSEDQQAPMDMVCEEDKCAHGLSFLQGNNELAMIFFEWLKQNKDYISTQDMRSIKLKRSTIESASKRLGSTEEGRNSFSNSSSSGWSSTSCRTRLASEKVKKLFVSLIQSIPTPLSCTILIQTQPSG